MAPRGSQKRGGNPDAENHQADPRRAAANGADRFMWDEGDGALKGFGVRMWPVRRRLVPGAVSHRRRPARSDAAPDDRPASERITPDQARDRARNPGAVAKGGDPPSKRRAPARNDRRRVVRLVFDRGRRRPPVRPPRQADQGFDPATVDKLADRSPRQAADRRAAGVWLTSRASASFKTDVAEGKTARRRASAGRGGITRGGRGAASRTTRMFERSSNMAGAPAKCPKVNVRGIRCYADNKDEVYLTFDDAAASFGKTMRQALAEGWSAHRPCRGARACCSPAAARRKWSASPRRWFDLRRAVLRLGDTKTTPRPPTCVRLAPLRSSIWPNSLAGRRGRYMFPADTRRRPFRRRVSADDHAHGPRRHRPARHAAYAPPYLRLDRRRELGYSEFDHEGADRPRRRRHHAALYAHVPTPPCSRRPIASPPGSPPRSTAAPRLFRCA